MTYLNQASVGDIWRLLKENIEKQQQLLGQMVEAYEERRKSFSRMMKVKVHHRLQDQWLKKDNAQFYDWLDKKTPFGLGFKSIPFEEWLDLGVGTVWFGAVLSETKTKTEIFCSSVRCGFEAKTEMKPNRLVRFDAVSNSFGLVFKKKCTICNLT